MTLDDFLNHIEAGGALNTPEIYRLMDEMSDEARRVTCEINNSYHSQEELRAFMSRLTGKPVDETFKMFPPFYTAFGKNITIGRRVFINAGCHFQDHGGVTLGDGCLIGHNVVFATLNHGLAPEDIDWFISGKNGQEATDAVYTDLEHSLFPHALHSSFKEQCGEYQTASSYALWMAAKALKEEASSRYALIYNQYQGINHSIILIKRCTS